MLVEPVAVAVGLERWSAVRAWLSNTRVPLASLQLTAADGRAAQQVGSVLGCCYCWVKPMGPLHGSLLFINSRLCPPGSYL